MSLNDFANLCCSLDNRSSRIRLFSILESYVKDLYSRGFRGEVWIDGSYLTKKEEPEDIDFTVVTDPDIYHDLSEGRIRLDLEGWRLADAPSGLDAFLVPVPPLNAHPEELALLKQHLDYWDGWWSTARNSSRKGYAVIDIAEFAP